MRLRQNRFAQAAGRAAIDLTALLALFPIFAVSFTTYRVSLLLLTYTLKHLTLPTADLSAKVKVLYANVRDEGLDGLKSRLASAARAVLDNVRSAYAGIQQRLSDWFDEAWLRVTAYAQHMLYDPII